MDGGAWWAEVHGVAKSQTQLSDFTFTFHFHALEKEMATHSSVLAWRIPGTEKPGGLPSMGSHRVGHDWSGSSSSSDIWCGASFHLLVCHLYVFFAEVYIQIFYPVIKGFFFSYCWVLIVLCKFWIQFFCQIHVLQISSPILCLFILLTLSFT